MADLQQNNHKKRDPAYYRAYRKRKKAESADNLLPFPSSEKTLKPAHDKKPLKGQTWFFILGIVFTLAITLTLIHLSAPFYFLSHGTFMAYTMACIVEVGLVILVGLELRTKIDRVVRFLLVLSLAAYSLIPIALTPIRDLQKAIAAESQAKARHQEYVGSLKNEIAVRKEKVALLQERGRISAAQSELQQVVNLEIELRNTVLNEKPSANITNEELQSVYGIAIQRVILVLLNIFLVHNLVASWKRVAVELHRSRRQVLYAH